RPNGVIITQAGSPYYAKRAFDCIDRTLQEAGFTTLPLHNQVVTLGEWGWVMGAKEIEKNQLKTAVRNIDMTDIPTVWLNRNAMSLITSFGKQVFRFKEDSVEINKIHNPVLYKYYLNGRWDIY
ncbi:MAG: spermidine synthase, partial [Bacteroidota bacterium]